jgi:hypothetical protein
MSEHVTALHPHDPWQAGTSPPSTAAHVVATIPLIDAFTNEPAGQIVVDNTWTATQKPTKSKNSSSENLPGEFHLTTRFSGTAAPATVTGTVPLESGQLARWASWYVSVTRV